LEGSNKSAPTPKKRSDKVVLDGHLPKMAGKRIGFELEAQ